MLKNIVMSILGLSLFAGCGLMSESKKDSIEDTTASVMTDEGNKSNEIETFPAAAADSVTYRVNDIEILAQEISFIPNLLEEIEREPTIFIRNSEITRLNEKYSFDYYTLLSGEIEHSSDGSMILNMRLIDNRYSVTKEYLNYKFNFTDTNEKSLFQLSGQEVINNHTFLAVSSDENQTSMKFDAMNNLLKGGLFRYVNQDGRQVVFKVLDTNKIEISVDTNLNNLFEENEKTDIIME